MIQGYKDTRILVYKNTKKRLYKGTGIQGYKNTKKQGYKDMSTKFKHFTKFLERIFLLSSFH